MKVLLDTCAILWAVATPERLSSLARAILEDPVTEASVSAISSAEIACACERGRIELDRHWKIWFRHYLELNQWKCVSIDFPVMEEAYSLSPPFHADPADRIVVATARIHGLCVLTADRRIREYPHVDSQW